MDPQGKPILPKSKALIAIAIATAILLTVCGLLFFETSTEPSPVDKTDTEKTSSENTPREKEEQAGHAHHSHHSIQPSPDVAAEAAPKPAAPPAPQFPWPPPEASSLMVLPRSLFASSTKLSEIDSSLSTVLEKRGYVEKSYYSVPGGFALVTRLEQFNKDGTSKQDPDRWATTFIAPRVFSLESYLSALFLSVPGHYRTFIFTVTDVPFKETGTHVTQRETLAWISKGDNVLPSQIGDQPVSSDVECTCLIYEFEQTETQHLATMMLPGLPAEMHLAKAGIFTQP